MIKKLGGNYFFPRFIIVSAFSVLLFSCIEKRNDKPLDMIDPSAHLERKDYESLLPDAKKQQSKNSKEGRSSAKEPSIPETTDILTAPKQPDAGPDKLVSISVTEDVPLKDVLIELSRLADVDMEIDPGITGGIIIKATNRPFNEVMKRVVELGGLRYENKNGTIKIERDIPYQVNYVTDFLNIVRSSTGSVNVSTNVIGSGSSSGSSTSSSSSGSSSSGSSGGGVSSGSTNQISSSYEGDLWKSVEAAVEGILGDSSTSSSVATTAGGASSVTSASSSSGIASKFNVNKQAGIISVLATQKQHNDVEEYLSSVKKSVSSQVLIEAKIVEVSLDKQFSSGIDWGTLSDDALGIKVAGNFKGGISTATDAINITGHVGTLGSMQTLISMLEKFGTSRTLSSPRLHAMNNQQAVLTFAENEVYFTLEVQEKTDAATTGTTAATTLTVQSSLNTVPIGVILALQPSIDLNTNEVTMNIRPTLSRITGTVSDPGVDIIVARQKALSTSSTAFDNVSSKIPVIEVRELDSILKVKNGEVMIIGGLMKDVSTNTDTGVPGISRIPYLGNAFKSVVKASETVETVIFIKPTIIPSDGIIPKADKQLYKKFVRDPRPLAF